MKRGLEKSQRFMFLTNIGKPQISNIKPNKNKKKKSEITNFENKEKPHTSFTLFVRIE